MITPFTEDGDVDYDAHVENMEKWNEDELGGYLVLGSNSETAYLNEAEKLRLVELTVRHARSGRIVIAGTGMESTRETIELTNKAADLGVQMALILTPFYYGGKMNDEALIAYFTRVADKCKIPVMIYNVTKFTHINISANAVKVLSRHENLIGMKDSSGDIPQLVNFKSVIPERWNLMVGTASAWFPALTLGVTAAIMALANCAPNECSRIQNLYLKGDQEGARELYERMFPVNAAVTGAFGIAGLKFAADLLGYRGGAVRSPLLPLKDGEKQKLTEILKTAGLV